MTFAGIYQLILVFLPGKPTGLAFMSSNTPKNTVKVTFYADPDIKLRLDKLDPGVKSHTINQMLRLGFKRGAGSIDNRFEALDARLSKLEFDSHFDGFAIAALKRIIVKHSGGRAANELALLFMEIIAETNGLPQRKKWTADRY